MNAETIAPAVEVMPSPTPWEAIAEGDYAIVEHFGHTTLVGRIAEVERFGAKMLAMEPLFNGVLLGAVFHGGGAIYRLTPCSREAAWKHQPRKEYQLPAPILATVPPAALPAPIAAERFHSDDDDEFPG